MANQNKSSRKNSTKGGYRGKYGNNNKSKQNSEANSNSPETSSSTKAASYDAIKSNDINWWNKSPMFADAVRVPFNRIYGDPIRNEVKVAGCTVSNAWESVPGILKIKYIPTIGSTAGGSNAPINRAFTSLYGDIYSKTTGAMQFQQADLALFVTAFSNIAGLIGHAKRILGVSQIYNGLNYYYPHALLKVLGMNEGEIIGQQDLVRMRLNDSILSFNNLKIPNFMDIYQRQFALAHNVYADEDNVQSQLYVFVPAGYYRYVDTSSNLIWLDLPTGIDALLTAIESTLEAWRNSSDLGIISGSIQRAFPDNELVSLDYVTSADVILPVVDRNINYQINNMVTTPVDTDASLNITQDVVNNKLVFSPAAFGPDETLGYHRDHWILNSYDGEISDEFIMEATRLMSRPMSLDDPSNTEILSPNTELVLNFSSFYYQYDDVAKVPVLKEAGPLTSILKNDFIEGSIDPVDMANKLKAVAMLSKFKHGPRLYVLNQTGPTTWEDGGDIGDVYRYTTIDGEAIDGLNKAALQSAYATNVPLR